MDNDIINLRLHKYLQQSNKIRKHYQILTMSHSPSNNFKTRKYSAFESQNTTYASSNPDNEFHFEIKSLRKGSADINSPTSKYKTEVCNYWETSTECPYGENCIFAHGQVEVRSKDKDSLPDKYKTKLCKNFHQNQMCPYGQRCQFIHSKHKLTKIRSYHFWLWFNDSFQILNVLSKIRHDKKINLRSEFSFKLNKIEKVENPEPQELDQMEIQQDKELYECQDLSQLVLKGFTKPRLYSL